jgi:hypothetical protein
MTTTTTVTTTQFYETRTTVRDVRQIAKCCCGVIKSRMVTMTTIRVYSLERIARPRTTERSTERYEICACGRQFGFASVVGRTTDHECDARCMSATGHLCECSCGGANHGAAYA